jgi:membrane-associated protein
VGHVLDGIVNLPPVLALALVFLLPALEASAFVGVLLPGEIGVILGGVLANQGKLTLAAVLTGGIAGAVIGDTVGYWVGSRYGETLLGKIPNRILRPEHVQRAEDTVRHFGGKAVFIGRFTAALRALVPGMAGMSRIGYRRFLAWNAAGGLIWASAFVLLGYLAGSQYKRIERYANYGGLVILVAVAVLVYLHHRRGPRPAPAGPGDH